MMRSGRVEDNVGCRACKSGRVHAIGSRDGFAKHHLPGRSESGSGELRPPADEDNVWGVQQGG